MTDIYGFGLPTLPADWLAARGTEAGPLFTNFDRAGKGRRLTGVSLYRIVRGLGEQHGVKVRPHGLRHTAITEACKAAQANGFGLEEVLDFSRHSRKSIAVLMIYRDRERNVQGQLAALVAGAAPAADRRPAIAPPARPRSPPPPPPDAAG